MVKYRKQIISISIGFIITAIIGLVISYRTSQSTNLNEHKKEVLSLSYDIMNDKLEHYVNELDKCRYEYDLLLKLEDKTFKKHQKIINQLNIKYNRLLKKYDSLKKEVSERDQVLSNETLLE